MTLRLLMTTPTFGPTPRRIALLCLPLALAACGITRPPAVADAPIPTQWNAPLPKATAAAPTPAAALPHAGSLPGLSGWWRQLDDPVLLALIESAQAVSPTVASASARIVEARATRVQSGAALLPTLDGTLSAQRSNSPVGGTGGGATEPTASLPGVTTLQAGLQSSWEIDLFGGRRASRDAAQSRLQSANAKWHDARVSVAAETANQYFAERACQRQLAVAQSDARSRSETARLTDLSAKAGFTAPADAALARASAADAAGRLTQQGAQCAVLRKGLVALSGLDAQALDQQLATVPADRALPLVHAVASVPAQMLAQRPDVFAAELAVAAASADVGAAEADRYPRLTLQGSVAALQLRSGGASQNLQTWTIGPLALTLPIFDGGTRAANTASAKARYDEAVALYRGNVRTAVREVEEALVNLQATDERTGNADIAVQNYQASFNATQARYESGLASLFELEDARRTLFAAQTARVALQRERAEAWVALYRSTGGGWTRPDAALAQNTPSLSSTTP
ncbi:efflux transporter outer membrane subunit [Variovorax boronicumulans]|uniref:efflux transporter outer membrane subunit n=1 Tax=Variovorax boronicumulans TaxID=436515 RepID=UPI0035A8AA5B